VGANGTFYGTSAGSSGELLFNYTPATGAITTALLNFPSLSHGSGLALGPNGNLYGFYSVYGVNGVSLFEVEPDGSNLQIFPFYNTIDGGGSPDGLLLASDGNFWVANFNGSSEYGNIISLSPTDGSLLQTISPFGTTSSVGGWPSQLIQAANGTFWGSTYIYGDATKGHFALGTVFSLNEGLPPR
jgi:streptogramin lyase